jgi:hypothetical protein
MAIVWLSTPAIVVVGSFGAGLAFDAISKALGDRTRRRRPET